MLMSSTSATALPAAIPAQPPGLLRRVGLLFAALPLRMALKFALLYTLKRLLNREASINYSQTGEDAIIRALLDEYRPGFYVDVGCHDPIAGSNTLSLYLHGWRGLNIDANPRLIRRFRRIRRRDLAVCAAVSDQEREMVFHEFDSELVGTLSTEVLPQWRARWTERAQRRVRTRRLDALLQEHLPPGQAIDLLSIDVEGHDLQVLRSIDLQRYRPRLLLVEIHQLDLQRVAEQPVVRHLAAEGYRLIGYDSLNAWFVDRRAPPGSVRLP